MDGHKYTAKMLKALAHPVRLQILDALSTDVQACVCHLETMLQLRQSYISQQLAKLREFGLVQDRREGMNVYYSLSTKAILKGLLDIRELAEDVSTQQGKKIQFRPIKHDPDDSCPCPRCHEPVEILEALG